MDRAVDKEDKVPAFVDLILASQTGTVKIYSRKSETAKYKEEK